MAMAQADGRPTLEHIEQLLDHHRRSIVEANALSAELQNQMAKVQQPPSRLAARAGGSANPGRQQAGSRGSPNSAGRAAGQQKKINGVHRTNESIGGRASLSLDRPQSASTRVAAKRNSSGYGQSTSRRSSSQARDNSNSNLKSALKKATPPPQPLKSSSAPRGGVRNSGRADSLSRGSSSTGRSSRSSSSSQRGSRTTAGKPHSPRSPAAATNLRLASFLATHEPMEVALQRLGWQRVVGKHAAQPRDSEIFKLMDIKGDGRIDRQELKIGLTRLRKGWVEEAELKQVMETFDPSGSGFLDPDAFSEFVKGLNSPDALEAELLAQGDLGAPRLGSHSPSSVSSRLSAGSSSVGGGGLRSTRSSRSSNGSAGVANPILSVRNSNSNGPVRPPRARNSAGGGGGGGGPRRSDSIATHRGSIADEPPPHLPGRHSSREAAEGGPEEPWGSSPLPAGGEEYEGEEMDHGANHNNNNHSEDDAYRTAALSMPPPPGYESLGGDAEHVAFGVKRFTWEALKRGYGTGQGKLAKATRFPAQDLAKVLQLSGCGLRTSDARFLQLLSVSLDPQHRGTIAFSSLERWLRGTMALVGAVVATASPTVGSGGGAPPPCPRGGGGGSGGPLRPEEHARRQIDALGAALSVSVPSIDHPALDRALLLLARLCMHTPVGTPLRSELSSVLSLRGHLPATNVSPDVQNILDRYDDRGAGFVGADSLETLLDDLDFYFPGQPGSVALEAAKSSFRAKLDFFGEGRRGVGASALQVWWADLEVVVGSLDQAMSDLDFALEAAAQEDAGGTPRHPSAAQAHEAALVAEQGAAGASAAGGGGGGGGGASSGSGMIGVAVAALVVAIQRANATMLPLGHRMLDEALAALHRTHGAAGEATGSLLPLVDGGPLELTLRGVPPLSSPSSPSSSSMQPPPPPDAHEQQPVALSPPLGPSNPALLGLCCLGGLHAVEFVTAHHFQLASGGGGGGGSRVGDGLEEFVDGSLVLPDLLADVGLAAPSSPQDVEALSERLGSGGGMVELGVVRLGLTSARLKLMRLQVALLHAVGSVAAARPGAPYPPCILIDDECAKRLEAALRATLVPSPFSLASHPLVTAGKRVLSERRRYVVGAPSSGGGGDDDELAFDALEGQEEGVEWGGGLEGAHEGGGPEYEVPLSPLKGWHLVQSRTDAEGVYWYNSLTGESRWDSPDRSSHRGAAEGTTASASSASSSGAKSSSSSSKSADSAREAVSEHSSAQFLEKASQQVQEFVSKLHDLEGGPNGNTKVLQKVKSQLERLRAAHARLEAVHSQVTDKAPSSAPAASASATAGAAAGSASRTVSPPCREPSGPPPASAPRSFTDVLNAPEAYEVKAAREGPHQPPPRSTEGGDHQSASRQHLPAPPAPPPPPPPPPQPAPTEARTVPREPPAQAASAPLPSAPPPGAGGGGGGGGGVSTRSSPPMRARGSLTALLNQNPISPRPAAATSAPAPYQHAPPAAPPLAPQHPSAPQPLPPPARTQPPPPHPAPPTRAAPLPPC